LGGCRATAARECITATAMLGSRSLRAMTHPRIRLVAGALGLERGEDLIEQTTPLSAISRWNCSLVTAKASIWMQRPHRRRSRTTQQGVIIGPDETPTSWRRRQSKRHRILPCAPRSSNANHASCMIALAASAMGTKVSPHVRGQLGAVVTHDRLGLAIRPAVAGLYFLDTGSGTASFFGCHLRRWFSVIRF
jgi:hypothetical protein